MSYDCCKTCGKQGKKIYEGVTPCDRPDCERKPHPAFAWLFGKENCRVLPEDDADIASAAREEG